MNTPDSNRQPDGEDSDHSWVDALLQEWLTDQGPPDFSPHAANLAASARAQRSQSGLFSPEELEAAALRAWEETLTREVLAAPIAKAPIAKEAMMERSQSSSFQDSRPGQERRRRWLSRGMWVGATAASLSGLVLAVSMTRRPAQQDLAASDPRTMPRPGAGFGENSPFPAPLPSPASSTATSIAASDTTGSPATPAPNVSIEAEVRERLASRGATPPKDPVPSALQSPSTDPSLTDSTVTTDRTLANASPVASPSPSGIPSPLGQELDRGVVEVIDVQFQHLWSRLQVSVQNLADAEALQDRMGHALLGRLPTDAERAWARRADSDPQKALALLAQRWIQTEEFDRYWAESLTDYYVGMKTAPSPERQAFEGWLQNSLRSQQPIGSMEQAMVTKDSSGAFPAAFMLQQWRQRAAGRSPDIFGVGEKKQLVQLAPERVAELESVSMHTLRLAGYGDASCLQCHRGASFEPLREAFRHAPTAPRESEQGPLLGAVAVFSSLLGESSQDFFVTDTDGIATKVSPELPGTFRWQSDEGRLQGLGRWMQQSEGARRSLIDFVWYRMLGQPLVPSVGLSSEEGESERRDLLEYLASQAQENQVGVRQLVYWIATSAPMRTAAAQIDASQFLSMDDATLDRRQRETRLFARYPGRGKSLDAAGQLSTLVQWIGPEDDSKIDRGLLAQPAARSPVPSLSSKKLEVGGAPLDWGPERLAFELADAVPYSRVKDLAIRLGESQLEWKSVVDHCFLACLMRYPSAEEVRTAHEVLQWSGENRTLASLRVLNTLMGQL